MEIIEILDDIGPGDAISVSSGSDHNYSSDSSGLQFISVPSSPQREMSEDGYASPMLQPSGNDIWAPNSPALAADALGNHRVANQREPDWRMFLIDDDDDSIIADLQRAEQLPELEFGQKSSSRSIPRVGPLPAFSPSPIDLKQDCIDDVLTVFPDICRDYVTELYESGIGEIAELLVAHILDKLDGGTEYPKAKDKLRTLKRKREVDADEEAAKEYGNIDRENGSHDYATLTRTILSMEFPQTPMIFIDSTLSDTRRHLYPAYMILEEADRTYDPAKSPYNKIKKPRATASHWTPVRVEETLNREGTIADTMLVLRELQAARRARKKADDKRQAERQAQLDEEENIRRAQAEGNMLECGCCFCDFPLNRMVHCENEHALHWFCKPCARQVAENEIGNSKYHIKCMSMDGCDFGFSRHTKNQFLDEKALIALDRNEQEEMLRLAGIENLESCPFCPFAAEYPSVEEDREFRCQAPDCEKISCRLCKFESHIPKNCAEYAKDKGLSVRRQIEEAMSAALIRKCNKCGTPFVKEEGCNKMTCTRSGCFNVQCYVCSKSCSYDHFNDRSRGGKPGNCPLFENVEERHHEEVSKAEKEALAKVRAEHPEYTEEDLKVKVSEDVKKDEERRRNSDPRNLIPGGIGHRIPAAGIFPHRVRVAPSITPLNFLVPGQNVPFPLHEHLKIPPLKKNYINSYSPVVRAPGGAAVPVQRPVEARPPLRVFRRFPEPPEWHNFDLEVEGSPALRAAQQLDIPNPPEYALFPADFAPLAAAVAGQREERIGPPPPLLFAEPGNLVPFAGFDDEIGGMFGLDRFGQDFLEQDFHAQHFEPQGLVAPGADLHFLAPPMPAPLPVAAGLQTRNPVPDFLAYGGGVENRNQKRQDNQQKQRQQAQAQSRIRAQIRQQVQDQALREQNNQVEAEGRVMAQIRQPVRDQPLRERGRLVRGRTPQAQPAPPYPGMMALRISPRR